MKQLMTFAVAFLLAAPLVLAHGKFDHIRGVVTEMSAASITVQTPAKATRTLTLTDKTTFKKAGRAARLADLKVGDRVVIDVPPKKNDAVLIQIGVSTAPASK
jgi:hypothetical protein